MPILEVISTSPYDSLKIQNAGADRIQLVSALEIGGLTPSATIIRKSVECVDIPTMVMIRHHNQGFIHSINQIQLLAQEVQNCIQMGVKGIVFGGLTQNSQIDITLIHQIKKQIKSNKVDVTFHKAFDQVKDIVKCYKQLSNIQINRVLTQGGKTPILQNLDKISKIISLSRQKNGTKVLLGGGINFQNVESILEKTNADEIHIGTCVRKNKYGPVMEEKLAQFLKLIRR